MMINSDHFSPRIGLRGDWDDALLGNSDQSISETSGWWVLRMRRFVGRQMTGRGQTHSGRGRSSNRQGSMVPLDGVRYIWPSLLLCGYLFRSTSRIGRRCSARYEATRSEEHTSELQSRFG